MQHFKLYTASHLSYIGNATFCIGTVLIKHLEHGQLMEIKGTQIITVEIVYKVTPKIVL